MPKLAILQRKITNYAQFSSIHTADGSCKSQLPSTYLNEIIYVTDAVRGLPPGLQMSYKAIYEFRRVEQRSQIVCQLCKGSIITPDGFNVASRYDSLLLLSIITVSTWLDD